MITKRIIPCLDIKNNRVVKGTKFEHIQEVSDPVVLAKHYNNSLADELVFYDITASNEKRGIFLEMVSKVAETINIPFTVGGGVRTIDDMYDVLKAGADKISINSAALNNPNLINQAASIFGNQCIVVSMDVKSIDDQWFIFSNGGRINTYRNPLEWAKESVSRGAGELVINAIDQDGVKMGYDVELTEAIAKSVNVPVIASGGAGCKQDFYNIFRNGHVDGALAASVFHYNTIPIDCLKKYLQNQDIPMRL